MVRAALRLTKEPPYFLSSISTWQRVRDNTTGKDSDYTFTVWMFCIHDSQLKGIHYLQCSQASRKLQRTQTFATQILLSTVSSALIPSYPADLLRVHSCLKGPCISCSPLPLACGEPDSQAGGVFVVPRPSWLSWREPRKKGPWYRRVRCCRCHCNVLSRVGKASGRKSCLCGCPSLDTGPPLPHCRRKEKEDVRISHMSVAKHFEVC